MKWLVAISVVLLLYWWFVLRPGRLDFWRVAGKSPDAAYEHFLSSPCWKVFEGELPPDYRSEVPKSVWSGPYSLWIPKLGGARIFVFSKEPDCEQSQNAFIQTLGKEMADLEKHRKG
jgi:hypothetical protein